MIGYLKKFDDSMRMSLRVDDIKLFKKYCKIWKIIRSLLGIEFDSEPVYDDTDSYIKTKLKMYDNRVNTNFQGKEVPKVDASYKCLSLIMLGSAVKVGKKYYPQLFLEECKYIKRKNKMFNYINDELEMTSSDDDDDDDDDGDGLFSESDSDYNNQRFLFSLFSLYNFFDILSFFYFFLLKHCFSSFPYNFFCYFFIFSLSSSERFLYLSLIFFLMASILL